MFRVSRLRGWGRRVGRCPVRHGLAGEPGAVHSRKPGNHLRRPTTAGQPQESQPKEAADGSRANPADDLPDATTFTTTASGTPHTSRRFAQRQGLGRRPPRQTIEPSARSPHEWPAPAATAVNERDGASSWPCWFRPQHMTGPSTRTAHVCSLPTAIVVDGSEGTARCPDTARPSRQPNHPLVTRMNAGYRRSQS